MVVAEMLGIMNDVTPVPPASGDPPVAAAYQSTVSPAPAEAVRVRVPVPQREAPVAEGAVGLLLTVAITAVRLADTQPVVISRACA